MTTRVLLGALGAALCFAVGFVAARSLPSPPPRPASGPQIFVDPSKVRLLPDTSLHLAGYDAGRP